MAILVTGAAGFVGNNTVRRLVAQGKQVRAMVRNADKASLRLKDLENKIEIVSGDVTERSTLPPLMRDITAIVHTVAIPMERGDATYDEVNYQGTINLVDAAEAEGVMRFINVSQNGATPDHFSRFLRSKGRAQEYVATSKLQWTAVRPSAIFGQQDEFFNSISRLVSLTPLIFPNIGGGKATFQPVHIDDVVEAIVRSLDDAGTIGKEFELGGPEVLTLEEIEKRIFKAMGTSRALFPAPAGLLKLPVIIMQSTLPGAPVNTTLLELLKVPNVVKENALVTYFKMTPKPFSGDNITYLKQNTPGIALKKMFTNATVT
ncbi:MAG: SDR family NAD(P)-dependent oxidoreductase [Pleurocapsa minor GSE-CHR-MK-17-07R]|jgi:NADH dehydrogenase|nr:SDR family NAD(P)-dependent oxidoreductase [Pleurocapsa minor GSE-CHR-MK 17-07R]